MRRREEEETRNGGGGVLIKGCLPRHQYWGGKEQEPDLDTDQNVERMKSLLFKLKDVSGWKAELN
jgi:hypothetical protein